MKFLKTNNKIIVSVSLCLVLACTMLGCSSDDSDEASLKFDHGHQNVSDLEKHKFAHEFAEQCIDRELRASGDTDRERFTKTCMCIANRMMENLTTKEAEKFLKQKKSTRSLEMRFNNAAYHCVDQLKQPQAPVIFNQR